MSRPADNRDRRAQVQLGVAVRRRRIALGLTQRELALSARADQRWISHVETGRRNPSYLSLLRLARGLLLPVGELIGLAGPPYA